MKFSGPGKILPLLAISVSLLVGCGNAKYQKQEFQASAVANQYVTTKPKIDVVIFQDNSDSVMYGPISTLKREMNSFLSSLGDKADLHFTVLPLLSAQSMSGKYVVANDCSGLRGIMSCLPLSQASSFNNAYGDSGWINSANSIVGSNDRGFKYMKQNLANSASSGFFRADAALAVITLSNGDDFEGVTFSDADGDGFPETKNYSAAGAVSSFNSYYSYFAGLKHANLRKFYSVVSPGGTCMGYNSFEGRRYREMSNALSSQVYNICGSGLTSAMAQIRSQLVTLVQAVRFNYIVLPERPIVSSIKVTKNGSVVPQSNSNGWQYVGYMENQDTSYFPTSGNKRSGYFLKLNGTAVYQGSDVMNYTYNQE